MTSAPIIDVTDVTFDYGRPGGAAGPYDDSPSSAIDEGPGDETLPCLRDLSFQVRPGTLTLLCGASGSGKSSALRLLNGLVPHFHSGRLSGTVTVAGVDVPHTNVADAGRTTATVFQNPRTQFFTSDVTSELAFRGENYGDDPDVIARRILDAARRLGITPLLGRNLDRLSGGELQKVACAQAVAAQTRVVLFDEPTSNLSPEAIDEFADLLAGLKADGHAVVVAEHRLYFLADLVDEVILLDEGRVIARFDRQGFGRLTDDDRRTLGLRCLTRPPTPVAEPVAEASGDDGLVLDDVRFGYGSHQVLDIGHLSFPAGGVSVLVGDNGTGKSTLARLICGLLRPWSGSSIRLSGRPANERRRLADSYIVMQDVHRQLFSDSVAREVTLGLPDEQARHLDVADLLARFDLDGLAGRHPLSLSGGQKQRLVIASAMACHKSVYVFDEPTSGVDHRHMVEIVGQLRVLADQGAVVIVITHDLELIDACADLLVTLRRLGTGHPGEPQAETRTPIHNPPKGTL
ncbi:energy-coupling factor ABC transporter ATP-binding protein [Brooklawnia cerclae]|uniref:Energy-coupling factor transport system ATP-binding protein n=1 Tax=Brooklawnia cerclae TaxID=349934 RepID=A0ABX0SL83_9ACTN|nr:ABC transporter ATP-binding protein [Brooklawnia cerclae]NIH58756.1 energy-coupling factor transport system ATP-binding protein [Brooklawnia cerclae]